MADSAANVMANLERSGMLHHAEAVSEATGVPVPILLSRRRAGSVWAARRDLYRRLRCAGLTLVEIAVMLDRHHSTVMAGLSPVGAKGRFESLSSYARPPRST